MFLGTAQIGQVLVIPKNPNQQKACCRWKKYLFPTQSKLEDQNLDTAKHTQIPWQLFKALAILGEV